MLLVTSSPKPPHCLIAGAPDSDANQMSNRSINDLLTEVQGLLEQNLRIDSLLSMSKKLQAQLREHLQSNLQSMLPSHNYSLPTGQEQGRYLAVEIGGSTLRVALVELGGQGVNQERLRVRRMECSPIDTNTRELRGLRFFDWMAERIRDMLALDREINDHMRLVEPLRMGIAWSFPLESVKLRDP